MNVQQDGLQAISDLEASLRNFSSQLEQDTSGLNGERVKQEIPALQQDALKYVGRIEEAMVQGFPFKVPEKYASLPQLKVGFTYHQRSAQPYFSSLNCHSNVHRLMQPADERQSGSFQEWSDF